MVGKGHTARLQGLSAESLLMLLQLWIAVLVGTEQEITSNTPRSPTHSAVVCVTIVIHARGAQ